MDYCYILSSCSSHWRPGLYTVHWHHSWLRWDIDWHWWWLYLPNIPWHWPTIWNSIPGLLTCEHWYYSCS